ARLDADGRVYRLVVDSPGDDVSVHLALGGIPLHAFGRVTRAAASRTSDVFEVEARGLLRQPDARSELLLMGRDAQAQLVGDGGAEGDGDDRGPLGWRTATQARLVLPVSSDSVGRLHLKALRDERSQASTMGLRVSGTDLPPQPLLPGWHV